MVPWEPDSVASGRVAECMSHPCRAQAGVLQACTQSGDKDRVSSTEQHFDPGLAAPYAHAYGVTFPQGLAAAIKLLLPLNFAKCSEQLGSWTPAWVKVSGSAAGSWGGQPGWSCAGRDGVPAALPPPFPGRPACVPSWPGRVAAPTPQGLQGCNGCCWGSSLPLISL